jgi:hypothetical protein
VQGLETIAVQVEFERKLSNQEITFQVARVETIALSSSRVN